MIKYKNHSIYVNYSLVNRFQNFIGKIYEIYGEIEAFEEPYNSGSVFCSALFLNVIEDADMTVLEQSILTFNKKIYPEYNNIFT